MPLISGTKTPLPPYEIAAISLGASYAISGTDVAPAILGARRTFRFHLGTAAGGSFIIAGTPGLPARYPLAT
eukprot:763913-Rhodomonas_salina.1